MAAAAFHSVAIQESEDSHPVLVVQCIPRQETLPDLLEIGQKRMKLLEKVQRGRRRDPIQSSRGFADKGKKHQGPRHEHRNSIPGKSKSSSRDPKAEDVGKLKGNGFL